MSTAYTDAAGRSSPTTVGTELANQTLVAGVYSSLSGTFGMTGTLTFDGEDNADSVFIFKAATTLITAGTGNVALINGAQAAATTAAKATALAKQAAASHAKPARQHVGFTG